MTRPGFVRFDGVSVRYGEGAGAVLALERADLAFAQGDFVCIVGPSGCGKTTMLQTLAGFLRPTGGTVSLSSTAGAGDSAVQRDIATARQQLAHDHGGTRWELGATSGIAIYGQVAGNGTWQYSTDGGNSWSSIGAVANNSALLLRSSDYLRFVPDGQNATAGSLSFRAWDESTGTAGTKVDATTTGGTTAFSGTTATSNITVTAINDAPVLNSGIDFTGINEDNINNAGQLVSTLRFRCKSENVTLWTSATMTANAGGAWLRSGIGPTSIGKVFP